MVKNKPLVTIGIPTYNRPESLEKAIKSAINQTYINLEIIISDNCSSDDKVKEICLHYQNIDERISYFRQPENKGMLFNYNFLVEQATGEYYFSLPDDDWLSENYIEECANFLKDNKDYAIAFGKINFYNSDYSFLYSCPQVSFEEVNYLNRIKLYCTTAIISCLSYGLTSLSLAKEILEHSNDRLAGDWICMIKILFVGKGKYIQNISYEALNNGASKDIESLKKYFNLTELTIDNFWHFIAKDIVGSIIFDDFYKNKLERSEMVSLALHVNNTLMKNDIKPSFLTRVKNKLRRIYEK
ncbi:glycosyltransferase [Aliarcobacter cryaerophilus]|uniref:glycosyltransferase family 2 protein n=1 Tax=Aliarcobacter cryaerophilus TaxID=28198 RepID=UPI0021B4D633|nr:glycosyltransferase family 2 protein [Aliarcobacter cryaerophilus]MCT7539711.1 glycosyltransferase [Aliarcobacter cryaerophilus]